MSDLYPYKVFTATDGIHTIYSVTRRMTENASGQLIGDCTTSEKIVDFTAEDIINLKKMHVVKIKTGHDDHDILEALERIINNSEAGVFTKLMENASNEDKYIIETWFS